MKKLITFAIIATLSFATVAEAKRSGGFKLTRSKPTTSHQQKQADADFNTTPNTIPNNTVAQAQNGNRMGNFVTGAAAGYLLSNMLSPTEAQAQEKTPAQAVGSEAQSATSAIPTFKQLDPSDPNVIERTPNYARYCLGGIQYMISGSRAIGLMDNQNQPQRCTITP